MQYIKSVSASMTSASTGLHIRPYTLRLGLCICLSLLFALILSGTTFAATRHSTMVYNTPIQQDIERAGVSVVRLLVTYAPATNTPSSTQQKQASTASPAGTNTFLITDSSRVTSNITCTGIGVIVSSWLDSTTTPTENNAWILSDATLVNKNGSPSGTCSQQSTTRATLKLASITLFLSSAYNNNQSESITPSSIFCMTGTTCDIGPVLIGFHSNVALPYLDVFQSSAPTQPVAIALSSSATQFMPATTNSPQSFLTPFRLPIGSLTLPQFNGNTDARTQYGMPVVNQDGDMLGLYASTQVGPAPQVQAVVMNTQLQTLLATNKADPRGRQNTVNTDWNNGINDYIQGAPGSSLYRQAHTAFVDAFQKSNQQFTGANHYASLTATSAGSSSGGAAPNTAQQPGTVNIPLLGSFALWKIIAVILAIIFFLALVLSLNALFTRGRRQHASDEAGNTGKPKSSQALPEASSPTLPPQGQPLPMSTVPPGLSVPMQMSPSLSPYSGANGTNGSVQPHTLLSPSAPVSNADIVNQPTLMNAPLQAHPYPDAPDADATIPLGVHQKAAAKELGFEIITNTNAGLKRQYKPNEDSVFAVQGVRDNHGTLQQIGLFIVADGMGGHADGKVASTLAIQTIIDSVLPALLRHQEPADNPAQLLADGVQKANYAVHQHNMENHGDMGTTVTTTMLIGNIAYVANVGDSRTYLYRPSEGLAKITRDHSVVASLVDAGIIKEEDIYTHTKRNQIYRSLGEKPFVEVDTFMKQLLPGDKLLLCSDGMWEMARDPQIQTILQEQVSDSQETGRRLIQAALDGGGEDNVSVIVVNVLDTPHMEMTVGLKPIYQQEGVRMPVLS